MQREGKRRRREEKRAEKSREEAESVVRELQRDMDRRYVQYLKVKKRRQRHFMEERELRGENRMCANGWMKGVGEERREDVKKMIDLEFDPFVQGKRTVSLQKDEVVRVGATHLKHEIEEANVLTNSSARDENSRNIECISDIEFIENEKVKQQEKIRTEIKNRVK